MRARALFLVAALCAACTAVVGPDLASTPLAIYDRVWSDLDLHYSLFTVKHVNWDSLGALYRAQVTPSTNDVGLSKAISRLLGSLNDDHVLFRGSRVGTSPRAGHFDLINTSPWVQYAGGFDDGISFGVINGGVGYIAIGSFDGSGWVPEIDSALKALDGSHAMVIDVRNNEGGFLDNALAVAGRFAQTTQTVAYVRYRNGPGHNDFTQPIAQQVSPSGTRNFAGKVFVLTGRNTISAAELFVMAMQALGHTTAIGDTTAGETGGPLARELQNGWSYQFPESIEFQLNGDVFEGIGLAPDVPVRNSFTLSGTIVDAQLAKAISLATGVVNSSVRPGAAAMGNRH